MSLSVVLVTKNEEANLGRTLESVKWADELVVVDSGSTDRTVEIARAFRATVFVEDWKGYAAQKNSALAKAASDWVLSLDADEEVSPALAAELQAQLRAGNSAAGYYLKRKNLFLGRWMRHGGFWPDAKLRLFPRGAARFEERPVHENAHLLDPNARTATLEHPLIHHAYPTLEVYLEHMRRYAELGAAMAARKPRTWLWLTRCLNPPLTFFYNYLLRLGFLDGREGFLLHWNHARYVGWKYATALRPDERR